MVDCTKVFTQKWLVILTATNADHYACSTRSWFSCNEKPNPACSSQTILKFDSEQECQTIGRTMTLLFFGVEKVIGLVISFENHEDINDDSTPVVNTKTCSAT